MLAQGARWKSIAALAQDARGKTRLARRFLTVIVRGRTGQWPTLYCPHAQPPHAASGDLAGSKFEPACCYFILKFNFDLRALRPAGLQEIYRLRALLRATGDD